MNIKPIPNELLGDSLTLITPTPSGSRQTTVRNVRIERSETLKNGTQCRPVITVWADCKNSSHTDFPVGAHVKLGTETFEITEQKMYRAAEPHHCKFTAVKTGDDDT